IKHVRTHGEVLLEQEPSIINQADEAESTAYLSLAFDNELLSAPNHTFQFITEKALWAAKLLMQASHYLLNRKDEFEQIKTGFTLQQQNLNAQEQYSADLMLRYLPNIISELSLINTDDPLIPLLESQLHKSTYSSILYFDTFDQERIIELSSDTGFELLAIERIVEHKKWNWLNNNRLGKTIKTQVGLYPKELIGIENLDDIINGSN
ncbi:MAG: hypothetical protein ACPGLV_19450, partial [Bacteroidia bacterium]